MPIDPADTTRNLRRAALTEAEIHERERQRDSRFGRWARLRSWLTALVGLAALVACLLLLRHTT